MAQLLCIAPQGCVAAWLRPHALGGIAVIELLPVCLCVCLTVWLCICIGVSFSVGQCHSQCLCAYYLCVCFSFGSCAAVTRYVSVSRTSPVELFVFLCLRTGKRKPILSASAALEAVHRMGAGAGAYRPVQPAQAVFYSTLRLRPAAPRAVGPQPNIAGGYR